MHNDPGRRPAARRPGYLLGDWLVGWFWSIGFCVSVGWPVTSPGFDDIPGSLLGALPVVEPVSGVVVLGAAGCCTLSDGSLLLSDGLALSAGWFRLPLESEGAGAATLPLVLVSLLVLVSGAAGVVRVLRCMLLDSLLLRPWPLWRCFLCLMTVVLSVVLLPELSLGAAELPLAVALSLGAAELSLAVALSLGAAGAVAEVELSLGAGAWGRAVALPLWPFFIPADPLSSPVLGAEGLVAGLVVVLLSVLLVVWARAPNAARARASALMAMFFTCASFVVEGIVATKPGISNRRGPARTHSLRTSVRRGAGKKRGRKPPGPSPSQVVSEDVARQRSWSRSRRWPWRWGS